MNEEKQIPKITEHAYARVLERHGLSREEFTEICAQLFRDAAIGGYRRTGGVRGTRRGSVLTIKIGGPGEHPVMIDVAVEGDIIVTVLPGKEERREYKEDFGNFLACNKASKGVLRAHGLKLAFVEYKKILDLSPNEVRGMLESRRVLRVYADLTQDQRRMGRALVDLSVRFTSDGKILRIVCVSEIAILKKEQYHGKRPVFRLFSRREEN